MFKKITAIVTGLVMLLTLLVPAALAANSAELPDPGLFLDCERGQDYYDETFKCYCVTYNFNLDDGGANAADEYLNLLLNGAYDLELVDVIEKDFFNTSGHIYYDYIFRYNGPYYSGSYINFDGEWEGDVHILVAVSYDTGTIGFSMFYGDGFTLVDSGLYTSYDVIDNNGGSSGGGGGGGGGGSDWDTDDKCSICDGTGWRTCGTCNGSGHDYDGDECDNINCRGGNVSCWTCGGDGRK